MDRIDLHVEVTPVSFEELSSKEKGENSASIRLRVMAARELQGSRYKENEGVHANAQMSTKQLQVFCKLNSDSQQLLKMAMKKLNLSAKAYDRILKVARTIAYLEKINQLLPITLLRKYNIVP